MNSKNRKTRNSRILTAAGADGGVDNSVFSGSLKQAQGGNPIMDPILGAHLPIYSQTISDKINVLLQVIPIRSVN
jgi:hypothetical protein